MASEVLQRDAYPYSATTLIVATFAGGVRMLGTGAFVGRNDVLTATHVLYSPDLGGWAEQIELYPAVDYSGTLKRFESGPLVAPSNFDWRVTGWPDRVFTDDDHGTMTRAETEYDVALIGLSEPVGDTLGWFNLGAAYDQPQWAQQLAYPSEGTGLMHGRAWATSPRGYSIYAADSADGGDVFGKGSSGGPLYVLDESGAPTIIGVKSSGSSTTGNWADIGLVFDELVVEVASNDVLLESHAPAVTGTAGSDLLYATAASQAIQGGDGIDTLIFDGLREEYVLAPTDDGRFVARLHGDERHWLDGVERLAFDDGTLALDVGFGEHTGQVFRLYQAAFGRTPDNDGLKWWLADLDGGASIKDVARNFYLSEEFGRLYGTDPANAEFVTGFYQNVLGREPDAAGYAYWLESMDQGDSLATVLVSFAESAENINNTSPAIQDGIWLV